MKSSFNLKNFVFLLFAFTLFSSCSQVEASLKTLTDAAQTIIDEIQNNPDRIICPGNNRFMTPQLIQTTAANEFFPNPPRDHFNVVLPEFKGRALVEIFDLQGKKVWNQIFQQDQSATTVEITASNMVPTSYMLKLQTEKEYYTQIIVPQ